MLERPIDGILNEAHAELGEDFDTFKAKVCGAVHVRPAQIASLRATVGRLQAELANIAQAVARKETLPQQDLRPMPAAALP